MKEKEEVQSDKRSLDQLILQKTQLEVEKLRSEIESLRGSHRRVLVILPYLTAIVAILGIVVTAQMQLTELRAQRTEHLNQELRQAVAQLGIEGSPSFRNAAIINLSNYLAYEENRSSTADILLSIAMSEARDETRELISEGLIRYADPTIVTELAFQNRKLKRLFVGDPQLGATTNSLDSLVGDIGEQYRRDIAWNRRTLIYSIGQARVLQDIDLAGVDLGETDLGFGGVEFRSVTFEEADLSDLYFYKCTFDNVWFNSADLTGARFVSCTFKDVSAIGVSVTGLEWEISSLDLSGLKVNVTHGVQGEHVLFRLENCSLSDRCISLMFGDLAAGVSFPSSEVELIATADSLILSVDGRKAGGWLRKGSRLLMRG